MSRFFLFILAIFALVPVSHAFAQAEEKSAFQVTGLPVPRFVSLNSDKVYMRTGPGRKYPIVWEYQKRGLPVEIVMEFDVWRKIRDPQGDHGWVHQSLLSGKRMGLVANDDMVTMYRKADTGSRVMAYIEPQAVVAVDACEGGYCKVSAGAYSGWIERKYIWGVYASEEFN